MQCSPRLPTTHYEFALTFYRGEGAEEHQAKSNDKDAQIFVPLAIDCVMLDPQRSPVEQEVPGVTLDEHDSSSEHRMRMNKQKKSESTMNT